MWWFPHFFIFLNFFFDISWELCSLHFFHHCVYNHKRFNVSSGACHWPVHVCRNVGIHVCRGACKFCFDTSAYHICGRTSRAIASLTILGGQKFHFPHFPQIWINFSYVSSNFSHFLPHFGSPGGHVAHPGRSWLCYWGQVHICGRSKIQQCQFLTGPPLIKLVLGADEVVGLNYYF